MSGWEQVAGSKENDPLKAKPIQCAEVAIQAGDGGELLGDVDAFARINAEAKVRDIFAYAGKMVLAHEELERLANPEAPAGDTKS
jgi:hypothetical protein